jgi:site-specific DNA recombinase
VAREAVTANQERPRADWIEIPVPALIGEETFARAVECLAQNQQQSPRRTLEPSLLQGLVHCRHCGYALYRTSTRSSARKIYYYRCLGSDAYRHAGRAVCDQKPIRQDLLNDRVWAEIIRLLEDPTLIQSELDRRLAMARHANPTQRRLDTLNRESVQVRKRMERLLTAYQEDLLSLDELRARMPALRQREQAVHAEFLALTAQTADRAAYLRLAQTLSAFLTRLRASVETLDIRARQRIMKLLVKEVVVGTDSITIKHSIPGHPPPSRDSSESPETTEPSQAAASTKSYLLCPWRDQPVVGQSLPAPVG